MTPALGFNATWGREQWAAFVLRHLSTQSVLLRAGARFIPTDARVVHVPRTLTDGTADWVAEGEALPSDAPTGDVLTLTPRKLGNTVSLSTESIEDAPVSELDAVGVALARSVATALDNRAFSAAAATAIAPAGLLTHSLEQIVGQVTIDSVIRATGVVAEVGGLANAAFVNRQDLTALRLVKEADGSNRPVLQPDLQAGGVERLAGALPF